MDLKIKGKTAVITGGTKGIGAGIAESLALEGVNLALAYRSDSKNAESFASSLIKKYGIKAIALKADVSDPVQADSFYHDVLSYYSTVDILINNAAGGTPDGTAFDELTYAFSKTVRSSLVQRHISVSLRPLALQSI